MPDLEFERYFFEIGVYSRNSEKFFAERDEGLQKHLEWLTYQSGGITREQAPRVFAFSEVYFLKKYGGWRYTQVIGWVRPYVLGSQIRGEIWFVDAKRIDREMNKRRFQHYGKAFELSFFPGQDSSIDIYSQVRFALEKLGTEKPVLTR